MTVTQFLAATAALEVQMLVCVFVCHTCYNCTGLPKDFQGYPKEFEGLPKDSQRTSQGLWTLWSTKFTSLQVAAPRSSRRVIHDM